MIASEYVILRFNVPISHADALRQAAAEAGAGRLGGYTFCSFSTKGVGRFMPQQGSNPFTGEEGVIEEVQEEQIETYCQVNLLQMVVEAIKKAHPYEEMAIEIQPIYEMGRKKGGEKSHQKS
jgi:hypothetical protein